MPRRIRSLDAMRALAVLFMLEVHLGFWWARELPAGNALVDIGTVLGGMAAPVFLVLAGVGLSLSRGSEIGGFVARSLKRGAALMAAGVAFTFVERAVYGPLGWGVLQCIGASLVICALAMRAPPAVRAVAGIALMVAAPILRFWQGIPGVLFSDQLMAAGSAQEYFQGMLLSGFFPLIPWVGFMLLGTSAGDWLLPSGPGARPDRRAHILLTLFLFVAGTASLARGTAPEFFPPSLTFSLLSSGVCLLALPAFLAWDSARWEFLSPLGRISLTVFIVHHLIGYEAFRAAGLLHSFEVGQALGLVVLTWALALLAARAWAGRGFRLSLEWVLARLERPPSEQNKYSPAE